MKLTWKIISWYLFHGRKLPWRETKDPYKIWISEIILQQTRVTQGMQHYLNFIERFPTVEDLHNASNDEVMLYWKGLGYYSRALNLHVASHQIVEEYQGEFPTSFLDLQQLKGVGKYTAAAIASICFQEKVPAIDGNFYRFFSRIFADGFDISSPKAYSYFYELILPYVPEIEPGDFNQAIMDLGATICKPKNPECEICPVKEDCLASQIGKVDAYPVKTKKVKAQDLDLTYYLIKNKEYFLARKRGDDFIWKNLYELAPSIPDDWQDNIVSYKNIKHKLTHKNLNIDLYVVEIEDEDFHQFAKDASYIIMTWEESHQFSFPKPLEKVLELYSEVEN